MYSLIDLIMTGITCLVVGMSVGALLIISAENDEEALDSVFEAGYEKGKADGQKCVMEKLEEYKKQI